MTAIPTKTRNCVPTLARPNTPAPAVTGQGTGATLPLPKANAAVQPPTVGADFAAINGALRRLYFSVQPAQLHPAVVEHTS
ncbi:hypothetical protein [Actinomadura chibensis]|uniref:hypothetical protein n=1 Tax=Actinomadura chibensis TaxID=392828 RepID=UPI0008299A31|nr:hypothetical protein [Actinomadura chibensis]